MLDFLLEWRCLWCDIGESIELCVHFILGNDLEGESAILPAFLEDALEGGSAILCGSPESDSDGGNAILEGLLILEWCR